MEKRERKPNENIQVFVRLRPANAREKAIRSMDMVEVPTNRDVVLRNMTDTKLNKKFTFDRAFGPESKQNEVYAAVVGPMIEEVLSGYNCTVFAYGQTGTGKTHTMVGEEVPDLKNGWEDDNLVGMVPRAVNHLFDELRMMEMEFSMRVSYLELYNEECFDLLSPDDTTKIRIFEDKKGGIIVHGLEEIPVHSKNDVYKLLAKGQEKRRTAPTLMNAQSSRSHTIFSIVVHMKDQKAEGEEMLKIGKLNLVDLAGSENISKAGNEKGVRARETVNINQSLLTLGRVMTALVEHQPHVPYRESKLTRLLQESLGGRTKTSIIATISPGHKDYEETANTLDYAHRAKNIQNRPEVNQRLTKKTVIKEFTEEIDRLKRDLMAARNKDGVFLTEESYNELLVGQESTTKELNEKVVQIRALKEQMAEKEKLFTEVSLHLVEKTEELRTTQDNLRATGTELIHTQSKLQTTDEKYRQQRFLLKHHEHTERKLQTQAKDLMQVAETATTDVGGLHEMLERRRGVDAQNQSKMSQFPQRIEKHFQGFTGNAEHFRGEICREADSIKHQIDESVAEARKNSAILGEELTGLLTICKDMASQSMEMFAQLRKNSEAGWTEVVDAVEERYLVKQKDFESAFKDLFRGISASVEKQNAIVSRIGEQSDALNESVHKEIENAEKEFAKLAQKEQTVSTALNEDMNAMQRLLGELQHKWSQMEDISREKEKSRIDLLATTRDLQKKHAEQTEQIRMESQTAKAETLQILNDAVQLTEQRTHMTTSDFEDIRKLTTRQVEIGQQTEATVNQQMSVNVNGFNESLAKTNERMVSDLDRAAKNSEGCLETVTAINDKVGVFVKNYEDFAQDCVQVVRAFCQNEVETYRPTGETPSKKNFSYPKTLSQTSPHGRILQRFRYDPNNSFNSSTDILPGLDDSMVGANIEEGVEPEGEEEEDVAFEDAQEGGGSATTAAESPAWKLDQENGENENPNVQRKKRSTGSGPTKATNRPLLEVRQRDIIYVSSDDD